MEMERVAILRSLQRAAEGGWGGGVAVEVKRESVSGCGSTGVQFIVNKQIGATEMNIPV
jgi:hypothetical protein